jgi:uncharacterized membrane protein YfcA
MEHLAGLISDPYILLVCVAALLAATIQSAIGLGFTPILAPVALIFLEPKSALQAIIVLSLISSFVYLPNVRTCASNRYFQILCLGALFGLPFGIWLLSIADSFQLRLAAAIIVTFAGIQALRPFSKWQINETAIAGFSGFLSGSMTASMGMSSPAAAWGLLVSGAPGAKVRIFTGTYLALVHIAAIVATLASKTVYDKTAPTLLLLAIPTVFGTVIGWKIGKRIDAAKLKVWVACLILGSGLSLFVTLLLI